MYKQERKAGFLHFTLSIAAAFIWWIVCDIIGLWVRSSLASDIIFLAGACVIVYYVYTHYCAVFSFELTKKKLIAVRKVGHREYKEEIPLSKINALYEKKPPEGLKGANVKTFTVSAISQKRRCYVIYDSNRKCIVFEPDEKLLKMLKENING